jgi:hypothetical protein
MRTSCPAQDETLGLIIAGRKKNWVIFFAEPYPVLLAKDISNKSSGNDDRPGVLEKKPDSLAE